MNLFQKRYLLPIPPTTIPNINDLQSIFPVIDHYNFWPAIPYLGCSDFIFYRSNDQGLNQELTLDLLYEIMGDNPTPNSKTLPNGIGLWLDLSGKTTDCSLYVEEQMEINQLWFPPPPELPQQPDENVIGNLQLLTKMAGHAQAQFQDTTEERLVGFLRGGGRAMVGFSEIMAFIPNEWLSDYKMRVLPLGSSKNINLYVDGIGVNSSVDPTKRDYAIELANLITSTEVLINSINPEEGSENPQYLVPIRISVIKAMTNKFPKYKEVMSALSDGQDNFLIPPSTFRDFINNLGDTIRNDILNVAEVTYNKEMFDDSPLHPAYLSMPASMFRRR